MRHKAISIHQPHVNLILQGRKTGELRKTKTKHRGDLIICSTKKIHKKDPKSYPIGMALCIVEVFDCVPAEEIHRSIIYPDKENDPGGRLRGYVWKLRNPRTIEPFQVKGQQGFYYVDVDMNKLQPESSFYPRHSRPVIEPDEFRTDIPPPMVIFGQLLIWGVALCALILIFWNLIKWIF